MARHHKQYDGLEILDLLYMDYNHVQRKQAAPLLNKRGMVITQVPDRVLKR